MKVNEVILRFFYQLKVQYFRTFCWGKWRWEFFWAWKRGSEIWGNVKWLTPSIPPLPPLSLKWCTKENCFKVLEVKRGSNCTTKCLNITFFIGVIPHFCKAWSANEQCVWLNIVLASSLFREKLLGRKNFVFF